MSRRDKREHADKVAGTKDDTGVALAAFTTRLAGYQPTFQPRQPFIILRSQPGASSQWLPFLEGVFRRAPATPAAFLADTSALGSVALTEELKFAAAVGPVLRPLGKLLLRLHPVDATLVAAGATCLVALKYFLAVGLTPGEARHEVTRLALVCPTLDGAMEDLLSGALRHFRGRRAAAQSSIVVFVRGEAPTPAGRPAAAVSGASAADAWKAFLATHHATGALPVASFEVCVVPSHAALLPFLAEALTDEQPAAAVSQDAARGTAVGGYRVTFTLSRYTKQVEQMVEPMNEDGVAAPAGGSALAATAVSSDSEDDNDDDTAGNSSAAAAPVYPVAAKRSVKFADPTPTPAPTQAATQAPATTTSLRPWLLAELPTLGGTAVAVRGASLGGDRVGTAHGIIEVVGLDQRLRAANTANPTVPLVANGKGVAFVADVSRTRDGRAVLVAPRGVRATTKSAEADVAAAVAAAATATAAAVGLASGAGAWRASTPVPPLNTSQLRHSVGVLLVRGTKVVLVRSPPDERPKLWSGVRFPMALHSDAQQRPMEVAMAAVCAQCDVTPDNLFFHPALAPIVCYPPPGEGAAPAVAGAGPEVLTLFLAFATEVPEHAALRDKVEEDETPEDSYDWFSLRRAQRRASRGAAWARDALADAARAVRRAAAAGLYRPQSGLGLFGDAVSPPLSSTPQVLVLVAAPCSSLANLAAHVAAVRDAAAAAPGGVRGAAGACVAVAVPPVTRVAAWLAGGDLAAAVERAAADARALLPAHTRNASGKGNNHNEHNDGVDGDDDSDDDGDSVPPLTIVAPLLPDTDMASLVTDIAPQVALVARLRVVIVGCFPPADAAPVLLEPCSARTLGDVDPAFARAASALNTPAMAQCLQVLQNCDAAAVADVAGTSTTNSDAATAAAVAAVVRLVQPDAPLATGVRYTLDFVDASGADAEASDGAGRATETVANDKLRVVEVSYDRVVPFHPARLAAFLEGGVAASLRQLGVVLLSGDAWVATRPDRRAVFELHGADLRLEGGSAWACVAGDTNDGDDEGGGGKPLDRALWHRVWGDRRQALSAALVVPAGADAAAASAALEAALDALLCRGAGLEDASRWLSLEDPLPEWAVDGDDEEWEDADE